MPIWISQASLPAAARFSSVAGASAARFGFRAFGSGRSETGTDLASLDLLLGAVPDEDRLAAPFDGQRHARLRAPRCRPRCWRARAPPRPGSSGRSGARRRPRRRLLPWRRSRCRGSRGGSAAPRPRRQTCLPRLLPCQARPGPWISRISGRFLRARACLASVIGICPDHAGALRTLSRGAGETRVQTIS